MAKSRVNWSEMRPTMEGKFYWGWVMLFMGFMCMFVAYVIKANCSSLFYTPICEEFGVPRAVYAQTNTALTICMMIGSAYVGKLFTKFPIRIVFPALLVLICLTFIGMSYANSITMLIVLSAIQGFGWAGATNLPVNIMVSNWFGPKVKGTMLSIGMLGSGAGALVWVPMMRNIMATHGWRTTYWAMAGVTAILIPLAIILCVNKPEDKGFTRRIGDPSEEEIAATGGVATVKRGVDGKAALKMPRWWCQFLAAAITMIGASAFTTQCVAYLGDIGHENAAGVYASALGTLIVGKFVVGVFSDIIGIKRTAVITPFFYAGVFVCLALASGNFGFTNGVIWLYMIGGSIPSVIPALLTVRNFGDKDYGMMTGWMNMAGNLGQIIGPTAAALVFDTTGSYVFAWWVFAGLFVVVAILYYLSTVLNKKELLEAGYDPDQ